jgi:serine/threonine protein kinase
MKCPDREQLLGYLRGQAGPDLSNHLESCPACQQQLEALGNLDEGQQQQLREAAGLPPVAPDVAARAVNSGGTAEPIPATRSEPPPRRLGTFELLHLLGEPGGQGEVWLARHIFLKCLCAVKILHRDRQGQEALARFWRTMELHAQLDHPNIVGVRHAEDVEGQPIFVMSYIHGFSFHELVQRHGPLPVPDACELIHQAARGLQHAHECGVVHRDVKPANLMLDRTATVKLLDLGLARNVAPGEGGPALTQEGTTMGTPEYMAPEQADDAARADIRADLYALGCTLFYLLTGQPPYPLGSGGWVDVVYRHQNAPIPSLRQRRPDVPERLAALVERRLLAKKPDDRLATPGELASALKPFTAGCDLGALVGRPGAPKGRSAAIGDDLPTQATGELHLPLDAALELVFWDSTRQSRLTLEEDGVLPVKEGDEFRIEVRLNQPGYAYLLWIDSEGKLTPLHPWVAGSDWELAGESPCSELILPGGGEVLPISGPAGVETLVLMARDEPLSPGERQRLPGWLPARFPRLASLPNPARPRWLVCRQEECQPAGSSHKGIGPPRPASDPLFQIDALLRERLGPRFRLVQAVSFTNLGPQGDSR